MMMLIMMMMMMMIMTPDTTSTTTVPRMMMTMTRMITITCLYSIDTENVIVALTNNTVICYCDQNK